MITEIEDFSEFDLEELEEYYSIITNNDTDKERQKLRNTYTELAEYRTVLTLKIRIELLEKRVISYSKTIEQSNKKQSQLEDKLTRLN